MREKQLKKGGGGGDGAEGGAAGGAAAAAKWCRGLPPPELSSGPLDQLSITCTPDATSRFSVSVSCTRQSRTVIPWFLLSLIRSDHSLFCTDCTHRDSTHSYTASLRSLIRELSSVSSSLRSSLLTKHSPAIHSPVPLFSYRVSSFLYPNAAHP